MRRIASTWLLAAICLGTTGLHAADFQISPLPLAKDARAKQEDNAYDKLHAGRNKDRTRRSVLIGTHDWAALEKEYLELEAAYRARTLDGDAFVDAMEAFAPGNGKIQLADLEQWVKDRPKSYIGWYTLGLQYQNVAWQERGHAFAAQTSREQFAALHKYGALAHAALRQSIALAPKPVASYTAIIDAAMLVPRPELGPQQVTTRMMRAWKRPQCPTEAPPNGEFATSYEEQLHYVCLAFAADPAMSEVLGRFMYFLMPRWGGSFDEAERVLVAFETGGKMPGKTLAIARARLLSQRGTELVETEPKAAVPYLLQAYDADPRLRNVRWLHRAAHTARRGAKDMALTVACDDKILAVVPDDADVIADRGWAYEAMKDHRRYMEDMVAAARLGKMEAQNNVGYYYMVGQRGLPRDLQQAHAWLTLAANQGFQHARDKLPMVEELIRKERQK